MVRPAPALFTGFLIALAPSLFAQRLEFPTATPESQGLAPRRLKALTDTVQGYFDHGVIVGAELVVVKNRHVVLHEAIGWKDRDGEVPMTPDTIFNIRSMTKTLTGAAVQILLDEDALHLDDPVAEFLEAFDNDRSREITIRQLLSHRSGLPLTILSVSLTEYESLFDMASAAGERGPEFPIDSKFWYSDTGTDVLGAVVEEVSGQSLDVFVRERLLEPIGMNDTLTALDRDDPRWSTIANLYVGGPGNWQDYWSPDKPFYPYAWGSQSLYATPLDYARFLCVWMDGGTVGETRVLSEAAVERTLTPTSRMSVLGADAPFPTLLRGLEVWYGQMSVLHMPRGFEPGTRPVAIGHSGSDGTIAWAFPEQDLLVLYFTQSRGQSTAIRLEKQVDELLLHPDAPPEEVPAEWQPLVGRYAADFAPFLDLDFEVFVWDGQLTLDLPNNLYVPLEGPDVEDVWRSSLLGPVTIKFLRDDGDAVSALQFGGKTLPRR